MARFFNPLGYTKYTTVVIEKKNILHSLERCGFLNQPMTNSPNLKSSDHYLQQPNNYKIKKLNIKLNDSSNDYYVMQQHRLNKAGLQQIVQYSNLQSLLCYSSSIFMIQVFFYH